MKVMRVDGGGMTVQLFAEEGAAIAAACQERADIMFSGEGDSDTGRFLETAASFLRLAHVASLLDTERIGDYADETKAAIAALAEQLAREDRQGRATGPLTKGVATHSGLCIL